ARNESFESEYRILTRAGNWIWVRDSGHILPSQRGGEPMVQGILMDVSERKRSEDALSLSKAQLLANLDNTPNVAVQWYDKDGHILYWNPASESLYGWKSADALGKTLDQLIHTPEEQAEFMRILTEIHATGKAYGPYEAQVNTRGGESRWVLATTFILPMDNEDIGFVRMDVDITERKQAEEQIQKQLRRLNALHTIDMAINSSANIQITLEVLLNQTLSQLNVDAADVLLFNQPAQTLELVAERGFRSNVALQAHQRMGDSFAGQVINQRHTLHIQNLAEAGGQLKRTVQLANEAFTDYIGVPLTAKGQIKGVLEIYQRSPVGINDDWLNFLEVLGGQAAIAIDNSQLLMGLQRSNMEIIMAYDATIEGWSRAMDLRDKETEGHTQRVTVMTLNLARAMGIREADIIHIQRGGLLHDMGKLGVPDSILLKAGALTEEEWEIMRQHPTFAFNMLAPIAYLKNAIDIPYCHHEKWDGTGYPRGLKGEQIPIAARIFAVTDVWDALTSDRPYRQAWSRERTIEFIREQSAKHFDPQVVEAFLKMITDETYTIKA
ncbi:MAG: HD domain-containing phosphohydrolase, partial [Chloroflexota bacterium]